MNFIGWLIEECTCPPPQADGWLIDLCECCVEPEPVPAPPPIRSIPKYSKEFYRITRSRCDIEANVKFGNAYYEQVKQLRYGIEASCPVNFDKIWIKKQLSDLSMLFDPTLCVPVTVSTEAEPVCVYPTPTPLLCEPATLVTTFASYGEI
jgi:hypothetical protein